MIQNTHKSPLKVFIGGLVIGSILGIIAGSLATMSLLATAFINSNL